MLTSGGLAVKTHGAQQFRRGHITEMRAKGVRLDPRIGSSLRPRLRHARLRLGVEGPNVGRPKAVAGRLRLGRTRHIQVRFRWLQEVLHRGRLDRCKIRSGPNSADALDKPTSVSKIHDTVRLVNVRLVAC